MTTTLTSLPTMKRIGFASIAAAVAVSLSAPAFAADESYDSMRDVTNTDWMSGIRDNASLSELTMPGTHDSLAIKGGQAVQTQENHGESAATLDAQLNSGIRAFDIRLKSDDNGQSLNVFHGSYYQGANFDDVMNRYRNYLSQHPRETVVLRIKDEAGTNDFAANLVNHLNRYQDVLWEPSTHGDRTAHTPTLGEVRGKVVIGVVHQENGSPVYQFGLDQFQGWRNGSSQYVQDDYNVPVVGAIATKRDRVRRHLDATTAGEADKMYVNFTSGSGGVFPIDVAKNVNRFLLNYMREGEDVHPKVTRGGMVMMDFPGGGLINQLLSLNDGLRG